LFNVGVIENRSFENAAAEIFDIADRTKPQASAQLSRRVES
jgi:hypothetical protein